MPILLSIFFFLAFSLTTRHTSIQFAYFLLEMAEATNGRGSQSDTSAMSRTETMPFPPNSEIPWANPLARSSTVDGVTTREESQTTPQRADSVGKVYALFRQRQGSGLSGARVEWPVRFESLKYL